MLGKMTGGEGRRPGGQSKSWHRYLLDDLKALDATKGTTVYSKRLAFGVEAEVWTIAAANKAGKWYRGVLEAAERFMACLLYTSPSPRDGLLSRMPSSA